jgi:2'-5' RNA ligase
VYYSITFYPELDSQLSKAIEAIRKEYDPTYDIIKPHVGIIFPATRNLDRKLLIEHIEKVLREWSPFEIQPGGFQKSHDHWLFLMLQKGEDEVKRLNRALYTGYLEEYRKDISRVIPHIGLGLFLKKGCRYDYRNPREDEFDRERYKEALRRAESLPLGSPILVEKLALDTIPDVLTEWTTGKRPDIPPDAKIEIVREFHVGTRGR